MEELCLKGTVSTDFLLLHDIQYLQAFILARLMDDFMLFVLTSSAQFF
jgi:hypothetical protein